MERKLCAMCWGKIKETMETQQKSKDWNKDECSECGRKAYVSTFDIRKKKSQGV